MIGRFLFFIAVTVLAANCGGDDAAAPTPTANVAGTWAASASDMSGGGITCSSTQPTQLTFSQSGSTFSGTYSGGELSCVTPTGTATASIGTGVVINGAVSGNNMVFDLDTKESHFGGTVNGNSISGGASWRVDFGAPTGVITLGGNWGATR